MEEQGIFARKIPPSYFRFVIKEKKKKSGEKKKWKVRSLRRLLAGGDHSRTVISISITACLSIQILASAYILKHSGQN